MSIDRDELLLEADQLLRSIYQQNLVFSQLLNKGKLPERWAERYLKWVGQVQECFAPDEPLPRSVYALIYNVSVYCTKRYQDWQHSKGKRDEETERLLIEMRHAGDRVVIKPFFEMIPEPRVHIFKSQWSMASVRFRRLIQFGIGVIILIVSFAMFHWAFTDNTSSKGFWEYAPPVVLLFAGLFYLYVSVMGSEKLVRQTPIAIS